MNFFSSSSFRNKTVLNVKYFIYKLSTKLPIEVEGRGKNEFIYLKIGLIIPFLFPINILFSQQWKYLTKPTWNPQNIPPGPSVIFVRTEHFFQAKENSTAQATTLYPPPPPQPPPPLSTFKLRATNVKENERTKKCLHINYVPGTGPYPLF